MEVSELRELGFDHLCFNLEIGEERRHRKERAQLLGFKRYEGDGHCKSIALYEKMPPDWMLRRLVEVKKQDVFSRFGIVDDSILVGMIVGSEDKYVIEKE